MLEIGQASDVGIQRKGKGNQDCIAVSLPDENSPLPPLLIVADGMGGYTGGALASSLVIDTIINHFRSTAQTNSVNVCEILHQGILAAHESLIAKSKEDQELAKMGSTVVAVVIQGEDVCLANVGDSRAYIINEQRVMQISWDHSLVGEMTRAGMITAVEAQSHPKRNVLTQSISAHRDKFDIFTNNYKLTKEDVLVLCSDGLWGPVTEAQIQAVVLELHPQRAAEKLIMLANRNQGPDNISVIVAKYAPDETITVNLAMDDTQP